MSDDEFDDLDDYIDEFDEEILNQEPGATVHNESNSKNIIDNDNNNISLNNEDIIREISNINPALSSELNDLINSMDNNGDEDINDLNNNNGKQENFKNVLNETINRIKTSSKKVDESIPSGENNEEELLTTLLKSLNLDELNLGGDGGGEGEDGENSGELTDLLMKALNKLTSKDMLYESIKNSVDKYGKFLSLPENKKLPDYEKYDKQFQSLNNVLNKFNDPNYKENDEKTKEYIDQQMEIFNSLYPPPPGLLDDNLSGLGLENLSFNDDDVPLDVQESLETCQQQ